MADSFTPTLIAAFAVGFVSFISPCVLPLVPGYLSAVSGISVADQTLSRRKRAQILGPAAIFCLSFSAVFIALGMTATTLGSVLRDHRDLLDKIAGGLIIGLGVIAIAALYVKPLNRAWRSNGLGARAATGGPLLAGAAFALAWTPCVGPTLGAILSAASTQRSLQSGALLLAAYSAGLAIPFLLTALAFTRVWQTFRWLRNHHQIVTVASGLTLIAMGALLVTGELSTLNIEVEHILNALGLDLFDNL